MVSVGVVSMPPRAASRRRSALFCAPLSRRAVRGSGSWRRRREASVGLGTSLKGWRGLGAGGDNRRHLPAPPRCGGLSSGLSQRHPAGSVRGLPHRLPNDGRVHEGIDRGGSEGIDSAREFTSQRYLDASAAREAWSKRDSFTPSTQSRSATSAARGRGGKPARRHAAATARPLSAPRDPCGPSACAVT